MDNQDKLYKQFQDASQKSPEKDFPSMEKVWGRVEEKLDKKALTKENNLWKKIAVAASVLLVITLGSQLLKLENDKTVVKPETEIVTNETAEPATSEDNSETKGFVSTEKTNPIIKENAAEIVQSAIETRADFVVNEKASNMVLNDSVFEHLSKDKEVHQENESVANVGYSSNKKVFQAVGVQRNEEAQFVAKSKEAEVVAKKQAPLYVINGKAVTEEKEMNEYKNADEIDTFEVFTEPLYVINGIQYSEEELFGEKPTSPYAPLNKQEILSTKILKGKEATSIYGEKGKKGVVIITTKNGKPAVKKN